MNREDFIQNIVENLAKIQRTSVHNRLKDIDLSHAQVGMLYLLSHHQNSNVKQTADFLGISKSAVTQLADQLEAKGLIRRNNDPQDRRIVLLDLTSEGTKTLKSITKQKLDAIRRALQKLDEKELQQLHSLSQKMIKNID